MHFCVQLNRGKMLSFQANTTYSTTQWQLLLKSADRAPTCELNPGICLTTEEKARKNLSQGSQRIN